MAKSLEGGLEPFGAELGKMIVAKGAGDAAQAGQARTAAQAELKELASGLRTKTTVARDPRLKAAGENAAASLEKTATNEAFFDKVKTINDVSDALQNEVTAALGPLGTLCG